MKILCISDQIDPQVYSSNIKERFADIDLILSAGDLPLEYLDFIISTLNKPLLFVFGNHHTDKLKYYKSRTQYPFEQEEENYKNYMGCGAVYIGSRVAIEGKYIFAGFGGSMRYNKGANQFTDFQMVREVVKIIPNLLWNRLFRGRYVDILLTHAPPKGIHDKEDICHRGFKIFTWFMKKFKPKFLVHGHVHLYDLCEARCSKYERTTVVNAFSHYVIELED